MSELDVDPLRKHLIFSSVRYCITSVIHCEHEGGEESFQCNSTSLLANRIQKAIIFNFCLFRCLPCGMVPDRPAKGHGSNGSPTILESVQKTNCQNRWSIEPVQNICRRVAGACLHLSLVGSRADLNLDNLVFDQCRRCTILNRITVWRCQIEDE